MLYAFLACHAEGVIEALTPERDAALMDGLHRVHGRPIELHLPGRAMEGHAF